MNNPQIAPNIRSAEQVKEAIDSLSAADWVRLRKIAGVYSRNSRLEADDLIQTAFFRTLEGSRHWPADVDAMRFFAEVMRSVASDDLKARRRKPELHLVSGTNEDDAEEFDYRDPQPNPEEALASEQFRESVVAAVLPLFEDDVIAQTILEAQLEEMPAEEIRSLVGLDDSAYASKRRLIRRRTDKAFPNGWTS